MLEIDALERRFLEALREKCTCLNTTARDILRDIRTCCDDNQQLSLLEVSLDYRENHSYVTALERLMAEIISQPIENPVTYAKTCVVASKLLNHAYTPSISLSLEAGADQLFAQFREAPDVQRWRTGFDLNMSIALTREGAYDSAELRLHSLLSRPTEAMAYPFWREKVHTALATLYIEMCEYEKAHAHLAEVDHEKCPTCRPNYLYAMGLYQYYARENPEVAAAYLRASYQLAKEESDYYLMGDTQAMLACIYHDANNLEAFWYAYERGQDIAPHCGKQALSVLTRLAARTPQLPGKELITPP